MYSLRTFTCPDCDRPVSKRRPAGAVVRCAPCAIAYSLEEQRQLAAHQGPHFEHWAWANALAARRMMAKVTPLGLRRVA